jgi:hypothetical protein
MHVRSLYALIMISVHMDVTDFTLTDSETKVNFSAACNTQSLSATFSPQVMFWTFCRGTCSWENSDLDDVFCLPSKWMPRCLRCVMHYPASHLLSTELHAGWCMHLYMLYHAHCSNKSTIELFSRSLVGYILRNAIQLDGNEHASVFRHSWNLSAFFQQQKISQNLCNLVFNEVPNWGLWRKKWKNIFLTSHFFIQIG